MILIRLKDIVPREYVHLSHVCIITYNLKRKNMVRHVSPFYWEIDNVRKMNSIGDEGSIIYWTFLNDTDKY